MSQKDDEKPSQAKKKQEAVIIDIRIKKQRKTKKLASVKQMTTELTQKKKTRDTKTHKTKDAEANRVTL